MIEEKTVKICGKEVKMRYCLAAEQGYEMMSDGKSVEIFNPTVIERDKKGNPTKVEPPKAMTADYVKLSFAAIVAAYECEKKDLPITIEEILFESNCKDSKDLVKAMMELRLKWYNIPGIIKSETDDKPDNSKNA